MSNEPEFLLDSEKEDESKVQVERREGEPTPAFIGASWAALILGVGAYLIGLFNATMELNEKGYYFAVLIVGLYSSISLQKAVRNPVKNIYYCISWLALIISLLLMGVGLYNAGSIILSEKGFYGMAFALSLFAAITVQKNVRDKQQARERE